MRQIKIKEMMKAVLWFVISVFFSFKQLSAQNGATRIIKGKVTASVSQSSVPGATISVKAHIIRLVRGTTVNSLFMPKQVMYWLYLM